MSGTREGDGEGATPAATGPTPPTPGALAGWRVLVPRSGEWGERVRARLATHGATAAVVPVIEFAPPADLPAVDAAVGRLARGEYDWLTVTSATTVLALAGRAAAVVGGPASEALSAVVGRTAVAAVGPGTARTLERHGVVPTLVPEEHSARGLLARLVEQAPAGARVLVPQSDLAELTLADGLTAAGWSVDVVLAYRTVAAERPPAAVADDLRAGRFDAVLLSSTSTLAGLLELVGTPPPSTVVACIGPLTAAAATAAGLTVSVVPEVASGEALVDALAAHAAPAAHDAPAAHAAPALGARVTDPPEPPDPTGLTDATDPADPTGPTDLTRHRPGTPDAAGSEEGTP
ncbi:uroporphyrinogen-III synthase [Actinotalea fermentans]|uniref:Uroporphyrinogen-III synthase n=1 Tax=Actinotalea fermentans TaxID=43671 RepID=A0A511Z2C4_9CELL|nr:uroporphyrinogen-III synthase [Actinotalea fermentans]GEN81574.1 hypothetical protein AFE02nite_33080 [Actinotalea fermentans]